MLYDYQKAYNELDKCFQDMFGMTKAEMKTNTHGLMKSDIVENENEYILTVELPDIKKEDINIKFDEGNLTISVNERKVEKEEKSKYILKERYFGKIERSYFFGDTVNKKDISAKFENGVLTVDIKKEQPKPEEEKTIEIA